MIHSFLSFFRLEQISYYYIRLSGTSSTDYYTEYIYRKFSIECHCQRDSKGSSKDKNLSDINPGRTYFKYKCNIFNVIKVSI